MQKIKKILSTVFVTVYEHITEFKCRTFSLYSRSWLALASLLGGLIELRVSPIDTGLLIHHMLDWGKWLVVSPCFSLVDLSYPLGTQSFPVVPCLSINSWQPSIWGFFCSSSPQVHMLSYYLCSHYCKLPKFLISAYNIHRQIQP